MQSGIGRLVIEAACSEAVGDLRLGLAFRRVDGQSSLVSHTAGVPTARDVSSSRDRFERVTVDLLGIRRLDRFLVCAYAATEETTLTWGGTLVVTTSGGSRVELPMDAAPSSGAAPLLSAYVVDGEIVLRAERWDPAPTLRRACLALGYDRITWLDPQTPVA